MKKCPEGKEVSGACTVFFLHLIDEDAPVEVIRIRPEPLPPPLLGYRLVVLLGFPAKASGQPMLNEIVCHVGDLFTVMKYVRTDSGSRFTEVEWERLRARERDLIAQHAGDGAPWEQGSEGWQDLLGGARSCDRPLQY
jgi:hypothetical protein